MMNVDHTWGWAGLGLFADRQAFSDHFLRVDVPARGCCCLMLSCKVSRQLRGTFIRGTNAR